MRIHNLLIALIVSTFTVATMLPWMAVARGVDELTDENGVLTLATAQQTAAKITVRIRAGQGGSNSKFKKSGGVCGFLRYKAIKHEVNQ
jgi:hypothetical protein